jgi:hypothetical protein
MLPPNLCADAKSWATSRFRKLPAGTEAFVKHENAIEGLTEGLTGPLDYPETFGRYLRRLLQPTENAGARRTDHAVRKLESTVLVKYLSLIAQARLET